MADKTNNKLCEGSISRQCPIPAIWRNQWGVEVCEHHKLLLNAFNWETRNVRHWARIK